jgi:hypothetical protein
MLVKVTLDETTGHWKATEPTNNNQCLPTTAGNVPNIPAPIYTPPLPYFPPIPTPNYPPSEIPPLPPTTLPPFTPPGYTPPTSLTNAYDIGDGLNDGIAASTTQQMLYFTTASRFKIIGCTAFSAESDVTIKIYATNGTYANLEIVRNALGTWEANVYNPTTGALIVGYTGASSDYFVKSFTSAGYILVTPIGSLFHSEIVVGAVPLTSVGYGIRGSLY